MRKSIISFVVIAAIALLSFNANAQNTTWALDKSHSSVGFSVDHLVISETIGKFDQFELNVKSDKPDFTDAKFDLTIQAKSINTDDAKRDEHLRSADFFDVAKFATITFKGKKFEKVSGTQYKVTGDITMHGVTKTVTLDAKFGGIAKDPWGNTKAGLKVMGELDRYDFGLKYNAALETGGMAVGQKVRISCNIELNKAK